MSATTVLWLLVFTVWALSTLGLSVRFLGFSRALVLAPVIWGVTIWFVTEGLSAVDLLNESSVGVFWCVFALVLLVAAIRFRALGSLGQILASGRKTFLSLARPYQLLGYTVVFIWLVTLMLAVVSPPNNWDSMTYHLPRVMNWIQNGSVEHYATGNARQLVQPPLSSYAALQSMITTRQDYLVNLIQWISGAWCLVVIACIAKRLKASNEVAMVAVFLAATIPIGIAESTTTQNEWLMSLWVLLMCFIWLGFVQERFSWQFVTLASGGLLFCAAATKQLSLFYAAVFFLALLFAIGFRCGVWRAVIVAAAGSFGASVALAPQFMRNFVTFGSIAGDPYILQILSEHRAGSERSVPANLVVHGLFNLPVPGFLPVEQVGNFLGAPFGQTTRSFFSLWNLDRFLPFPGLQLQEDSAASPITFFLGLVALVWFLWKFRGARRAYAGAVLVLFGMVLFAFSAQIGSNRYLLTAMLLSVVPLAVWLEAIGKWLLVPVVVIAGSYGLFFAVFMEYRPILPNFEVFTSTREELYFKARPDLLSGYQEFDSVVSEARVDGKFVTVGVRQAYDDWEYPLWILSGAPWAAEVVHIGVGQSGEAIDPAAGLRGVDVAIDTRVSGVVRVEPSSSATKG